MTRGAAKPIAVGVCGRETQAPSQEALACWRSVESFLKEVYPRLKSIAASHRVPARDAEDLMQEALLTLVARSTEIRSPTAWVVATFTRKCQNYWQQGRKKPGGDRASERNDPERLEEGLVDASEGSEPWVRWDVNRALRRLPDGMRRVVWLRHVGGFSSREVAERTGYSQESVRQIHGRALRKLRRHFGMHD